MNALISVIVPVYNVENYLAKCLDSIISQTYKNLQIILIDDGSTDNSGVICDKYKQIDSRIEVIHKTNGGVGSARETGVNKATGEYIAFVDPDDFIDCNMYSKLYKAISNNNADIAVCNILRIENNKKSIFGNTIKFNEIHTGEKCFENYISNLYNFSLLNKLFKKSLFDDLTFEKLRFSEDVKIQVYIFVRANTVVCINDVLYFYIKRKDSLTESNKINSNYIYTQFSVYQFLFEYTYKRNEEILRQYVPLYVRELLSIYDQCMSSIDYKKLKDQIEDSLKRYKKCILKYSQLEKSKKIKLIVLLNSKKLYKFIYIYERYIGSIEKNFRRKIKAYVK